MPASARTRKLIVGVTGANGCLGRLAVPALLRSARVARVVALDLAEPAIEHPRLSFAPIDLANVGAPAAMAQALRAHAVDSVVHLAFFSRPVRDANFAHQVEAVGTGHVLAACREARVRRLVMSSSTLVYGASPGNPNFLSEVRPVAASSPARYVADKIDAERQLARANGAKGAPAGTILRFAPIVGPTVDTPITRYLGRPFAPTILGHDPLVQCVHEDDAVAALLLALFAGLRGPFNVCGRGVLPLSAAVRLAGATPLPLPMPIARTSLKALDAMGMAAVPTGFLDYLRFLWVADGTKAERDLGFRPRYTCRDALLSFAVAHDRASAA